MSERTRQANRVPSPTANSGSAAVVVANPSALSWMPQIAAGLARAGMLRSYYSTLATTQDEIAALRRLLPERITSRLSLRSLPAEVSRRSARRIATADDLVAVAALAARRPGLRRRAMARKSRRFDKRVSALLRPTDEAAVVSSGASILALRRARELGLATFLDCPITHHALNVRMMRDEARLVPDYAETIQGTDYPPELWAQLEEELECADHVIVLSAFHRQSYLEAGVDEQRLLMLHYGVDTHLFRPAPRSQDGVFRVIFSGQITQRKGISYLVEGFKRAAIPGSELLMVGRPVGPKSPWAGVEGVRHVPSVPRYELPQLYATGDVYVMPSLLEGCCLTVLEAMAMGLPTIATPNTSDAITDAIDGLIVPIRDPEAIAERLRLLHADPDLAHRLGSAARATAELYDWRRYGDLFAEMVTSALRTSASARHPS